MDTFIKSLAAKTVDLTKCTNEQLYYVIINNPWLLKDYFDSDFVNMYHVMQDPETIAKIKNQTELLCHVAMEKSEYKNWKVFIACKYLSDDDCYKYISCIDLMNQTDEFKICLYGFVKNRPEKILNLFGSKESRRKLYEIQDMTIEEQMELLKNTQGQAIQHFINQSENLCNYAILCSNDGTVIQYIKNPTKKQINVAAEIYVKYMHKLINHESDACDGFGEPFNYEIIFINDHCIPYMENLIKNNNVRLSGHFWKL
jgi:hypothetical protein